MTPHMVFLKTKTLKSKNVVFIRRPIESFIKRSDIERICGDELRKELRRVTNGLSGIEFEAAVREFARNNPKWPGLRRIRTCETLKTIKLQDRTGTEYKGVKGDSNYRYDVWELPDGKWVSDVVTMFDAHQQTIESPVKRQHPTARKIMRLHQNDMVALDHDGEEIYARVVKFRVSGQIVFAGHKESGALKNRDAASNDEDPFKYINASATALKKRRARKIRVDAIGRIHDPGPR